MPRRGDNIRKRTDGRWEGRYPVTSADGKKRYLSVYGKSYREVKEKLTAKMYLLSNRESPAVLASQLNDGMQIYDTGFCVLVEEWLVLVCTGCL